MSSFSFDSSLSEQHMFESDRGAQDLLNELEDF